MPNDAEFLHEIVGRPIFRRAEFIEPFVDPFVIDMPVTDWTITAPSNQVTTLFYGNPIVLDASSSTSVTWRYNADL